MFLKRYTLAAVLIATPVHAQWEPQAYKADYEGCVPACDKNNTGAHDKCVGYCRCVMDSLQTQFPDHAQMQKDYGAKLPAAMTAVQNIANTCNRRFFGSDTPRKIQ